MDYDLCDEFFRILQFGKIFELSAVLIKTKTLVLRVRNGSTKKERRLICMTIQTLHLLDECNSGCKMAINSMKQVRQYIKDEKLATLIDSYTEKHEKLEEETGKQLMEYGKAEDRPGVMAKAMSWISTETKLMLKDDATQIAKIIMDGCNMGIQSLSRYINEYVLATPESVHLAQKIIKTEEDLMREMKQFM